MAFTISQWRFLRCGNFDFAQNLLINILTLRKLRGYIYVKKEKKSAGVFLAAFSSNILSSM